ncbi:hypothetical protein [Oceaniglobus indicus]|uniref:hypothetical protein n=1 Tax=Oceaniglobus indicus TaxID=2047749 RepID=UPI000C18F23F|nr:hypothetical protein [Oceaniglobus indicus]
MKRADLMRLKAIADMKRDADLQNVSRIAAQMAALQADIDRIRNHTRTRAASLDLDAARMSGADVKWQQASEQHLRALQQRRAGLAAAREGYLGVARKSFGRAEALRMLADSRAKPRST